MTLPRVAEMKANGEPIVMVTAYDYPSAQIVDEAGVDIVLVGDTVQHDLHHVRPKCDWANSSYVRNETLVTEADRYFEAWGGLLSHVYVGNSVRGWQARPSASPVAVRVG